MSDPSAGVLVSHMRFLARVSRELGQTLEYEDVLRTAATLALPYDGSWCIVDIVEDDESVRRVPIHHPDPALQRIARRLTRGWPPRRHDRPGGPPEVTRTGRGGAVVEVTDAILAEQALGEANLNDLKALDIGFVVEVPLVARERILGSLTFVGSRSGRRYAPSDVALAEDLAARCAMALDNARLFADAREARRLALWTNEQLLVAALREQELAEKAGVAAEAKSRFLSAMSHEIRTPIHAILGYTKLLEDEIAGPITTDQKQYLARIRTGGKHLVQLVSNVLDLSKLEAGRLRLRREPLSSVRLVSEVAEVVQPLAAQAGITLQYAAVDGADPHLWGDEERVHQILLNLLSNAVKFTPEGGRVTLTTGSGETAPLDGRTHSREGTWTYVGVRDTGVGIPDADHEAVFEPFVQATPGPRAGSRSGTGLGLTISRDLARLMDGEITLESREGEGSLFTLWLPEAPSQDPGPRESASVI